ncbi:MAG: helix-turn-helix transcriptional regulator [Proteobacteria bacterium]|nr:helix-turn-helix transcriptional regulator [Pseudomonadota bacterium]
MSRRGDGLWQQTHVEPGVVWLCPSGVLEEDIRISHWHDVLHVYLPAERFAQHSEARGGATIHPDSVRYLGGLNDELLRKGGASLVAEMSAPTSTGRLLAEVVAVALTARIAEQYASDVRRGVSVSPRHMLSELRLRRVLQYMVEHMEDDIGLDDLAAVAGLSVFHFTRMFANRIGMPPHRYLGQMRLERAKTLLALGKMSIAQISCACRFSSQSNFSRAFRRATGATPLAYRNEARN